MLRTAGGITVNQTTNFAGYYGSFYSSVTQFDGVNTPTLIYAENTADADGVSMELGSSSKKSRMTFAHTGTYNIQISAQIYHGGGGGSGEDLNIWFRLNGVDIANSDTRITITPSSKYTVAAWNFIVSVSSNQYVELVFATNNSKIEFLAEPAATSPYAHPAIPSIILTAQQIR